MTMEKLGIKHMVLLFGIILLVIGLVGACSTEYPYQNIGIILIVAGIVFVALGWGRSAEERRSPPQPSST